MAIDTSYWADDLDAMIADLPTSAKFGTDEFTCAATELTQEETLIITGNDSVKAVRVTFPQTAFTAGATFKPQARFSLKFPTPAAFVNYEIVSINPSPDNVAYEVVLKADSRA